MSTHSGGSSNPPWGDREEDDDEMNLFGTAGDDTPMASPSTSRTAASLQFPPEPSTPTPKTGKGKKKWTSTAAQLFFFKKKRKSTIYYAGLDRSPRVPTPGYCTKGFAKKSYGSEYYSLPIIALVCIPMLLTSGRQRCG
jgi:hypothetical protein